MIKSLRTIWKQISKPEQNYVKGVSLAVISSIGYASNIVLGKYAITQNPALTTYDINLIRGIVSIVLNSIFVFKAKAPIWNFSKQGWWLLFLANLAGVLRSYPTVWAYQFISGSKCILMINISPVLIVILGGLLLHERVSFTNYVAAVLALSGGYLLTLSRSDETVPNSNPVLGYTFALTAGLARAFMSLVIRVMNKVVHYLAFPFYYSIVLLVIGGAMGMLYEDQIHIHQYSIQDTVLLVLASLGTTFGILTISLSLKYMNASAIAPISNFEVLFAFIADIFVFNYTFYMLDFIGAGVIFGSLAIHIALEGIRK